MSSVSTLDDCQDGRLCQAPPPKKTQRICTNLRTHPEKSGGVRTRLDPLLATPLDQIHTIIISGNVDLSGVAVVGDADASEGVRQTRAVRPDQTSSLEDVRS